MSLRSLRTAMARVERLVPSVRDHARAVAMQRTRARLQRLSADPAACAAMDACADRMSDLSCEGREDELKTDPQLAALKARLFEVAPWMGRATE